MAIVGAARSADRFAGPGASFFRANVTGAVVVEYDGTGSFSTGTPGTGRQQFQVVSEASDASGAQSVSITRWDGGRLAAGVYPVALVDVAAWEGGAGPDGQPRGLTIQYRRVADGWSEHFVAAAGTLEITARRTRYSKEPSGSPASASARSRRFARTRPRRVWGRARYPLKPLKALPPLR